MTSLDVLRIIALTTADHRRGGHRGVGNQPGWSRWLSDRNGASFGQVTDTEKLSQLRPARDERSCLACGGNGEVLRSDGAGRFEPRACPECQPARLAG